MNILKLIQIVAVAALIATSCHKINMDGEARKVAEVQFSNTIPVPATLDGTNASLDAHSGIATLAGGLAVDALGYGDASILGPTFRVQQGDQFNLLFTNNMTEATNIHWHGLEVPARQDGYPTDVTAPGASFQYSFPIKNRPGTYWYHPHPDMATASQAYRGLAGFFIVTSPEEDALNLPAGLYEVPIVVQDKRLDAGMHYDPDAQDRNIGMFGESILVNGAPGAVLEVANRTYRFRLLNGSNARIYNFALSNGASFQLIGSDGGLLNTPVEISSILLAPGERADVLIHFNNMANGTSFYLQSNKFSGMGSQGGQAFKVLEFKVVRQETDDFVMPATLMPVEQISAAEVASTRKFNIGQMMGTGGMGGMNGMNGHNIDGKTYDAARIDESVKAGTVEIWEFDNNMGMEGHPMHLHGVQFQVLSRSGGRGVVQAWEKGWKDTVLVLPGERVRIIIRFPDNKGKFVFHCHNLEHEDGGMMLNFEIQ